LAILVAADPYPAAVGRSVLGIPRAECRWAAPVFLDC